VRCFRLSVA